MKDILLMSVLAFTLFFTAWIVFDKEDEKKSEEVTLSEREKQVMRILEELDGVGEASVVVSETNEEIRSVVVFCEGARDFQVVMDIREAVSTALGAEQKFIKIYLKKE